MFTTMLGTLLTLKQTQDIKIANPKTFETSFLQSNIGTYPDSWVTFLLKDLTGKVKFISTIEREMLSQSSQNFASYITAEAMPDSEMQSIYDKVLNSNKQLIADSVGNLVNNLVNSYGDFIAVSLLRAGTPAGILVRLYAKEILNLDIPHYSVSIVSKFGLDHNAINYIQKLHPDKKIVFIDGWTGKGFIQKELSDAVKKYNSQAILKGYKTLEPTLATIYDPAGCSNYCGLNKDILMPTALMNCTLTGLLSRSILDTELVGPNDFHGVNVHLEMKDHDQSLQFIESIVERFREVELIPNAEPHYEGRNFCQELMLKYNISNPDLVKASTSEATKALLLKENCKVLLLDVNAQQVESCVTLANRKNIPIEYIQMPYNAIVLLKSLV